MLVDSKNYFCRASVRGASVLVFLLGITWVFGILWFSENSTVLAYLFCIFNTFQGMFIFICHCVLPRKVSFPSFYSPFSSQLSMICIVAIGL